MRKLGIVFSGGGIRGMAHVGLIDALREEGIEFDLIAGTSAGALVGALYANGYRSEEMLEAFSSVPLFSVNNFTFRKPGLIDTLRLRKFIRKYLPENSFESLKKQLFINSVNLEKGKSVAHSSGKLYRPLLAS
ncbi:MAG: patatin-like phospholipase family protein, partial [Bacteroidota bacterium]